MYIFPPSLYRVSQTEKWLWCIHPTIATAYLSFSVVFFSVLNEDVFQLNGEIYKQEHKFSRNNKSTWFRSVWFKWQPYIWRFWALNHCWGKLYTQNPPHRHTTTHTHPHTKRHTFAHKTHNTQCPLVLVSIFPNITIVLSKCNVQWIHYMYGISENISKKIQI